MTTDTLEAAKTVKASVEADPNRMALDSAASRLFMRFLYRAPFRHTLADVLRTGYFDRARAFGLSEWAEIHAIIAPEGTPEGAEVVRLMVIEAPREATDSVVVGLIDRHKVQRAK